MMSEDCTRYPSLTWLGHAAFLVRSNSRSVLIDPWLADNPAFPGLPADLQISAILVTHGHFDHLGDAITLSQEHGAPVIAPGETGIYCKDSGATTELINVGGEIEIADCRIECVPAVHSNSCGPDRRYGGLAAGFVLEIDGKRIYHAGDTAFFSDMSLIPGEAGLDVALLPIGGRSTMGPSGALRAAALLDARLVIPMHYNTWPMLNQDGEAFSEIVRRRTASRCHVLKPGEALMLG
jgi:L-ascorbate metabolism protein UlaG (beta-lactamase superfamily)